MFMREILDTVKSGGKIALVMVTASSGSTPADVGKEMIVFPNGVTRGTVGGGNLERVTVEDALKCLQSEESKHISYNLKEDLKMNCGGEVGVFIKIYKPQDEIIIVGGGHVGRELNKFAKILDYKTIVIDDREIVKDDGALDSADEVIIGDYNEIINSLDTNSSSTYIVITTHGHRYDEDSLYACMSKDYKYIGVIGSAIKVKKMMQNLEGKGIPKEKLEKVYSPIGICLGGNSPAEVALSIIAEINLCKYNGKLEHMKKKYEEFMKC